VVKIKEAFERALGEILARVSLSDGEDADHGNLRSIAVAYSGGLDSSALLHLAHDYSREHGISLHAFHVHHGLSGNADEWLRHCESQCERLGISFDVRHVAITKDNGKGIEEAARSRRYAALGEMCRTHQVSLLLTAHHQDDQAETVLLQLLRGAGVAGLSGMDASNTAAGLLGDPDLTLARPLLSVTRNDLESYAARREADHVEDESNADLRFSRNALRHQVLPLLAHHFPGFQERLARTARHAQFAQRLLDQLAQADWQICRDREHLDAGRLKCLDSDRISNLLRYWLGLHGLQMPSTAWLLQAQTQLLAARDDAQICIALADCEIRRYRNRIMLIHKSHLDADEVALPFAWRGETQIYVKEYGGTLQFSATELDGVDAVWLRGQQLQIRNYRGELRLKIATNRSTRSLKSHCQERSIPAWERKQMPLLFIGAELLFAAGVGTACKFLGEGPGQRIRITWESDRKDIAAAGA
jgi:tRNA(Ile)-lysidine synthase